MSRYHDSAPLPFVEPQSFIDGRWAEGKWGYLGYVEDKWEYAFKPKLEYFWYLYYIVPISTKSAAALLKLSPRQIQRLAKQGRIPGASKPGGHDWVFQEPIEVLPPERPQGWPQGLVSKAEASQEGPLQAATASSMP